jgi:hypothetical protein
MLVDRRGVDISELAASETAVNSGALRLTAAAHRRRGR